MSTMLVRDVMSASPVTLSPTTSVGDLLARFDRHDFNAFPVVDEPGRVLGVVSKLDVLRAFLITDRMPLGRPADAMAGEQVTTLMSYGVIAVAPDDALAVAGDLMVETKLHSLPVIEPRDGLPVLVGIISRGDVLRGLRFQLADGADLRGDPGP